MKKHVNYFSCREAIYFISASVGLQKTASSNSYGKGWFANFQKLISPKQNMKFLQIFIDDAEADVATFLKERRTKTNLWEHCFKYGNSNSYYQLLLLLSGDMS